MKLLALLFCSMALCFAQTPPSATPQGTVTGPDGAPVDGAPVQARNEKTGAAFRAVTAAKGEYTWMGHAVGRWEGDTLVVDAVGFNKESWLDNYPHTEQLHVIERYHRRDFGHMDIQITIDDPVMYTKPWTVTMQKRLIVDDELIEWMCENEKDMIHMVGK